MPITFALVHFYSLENRLKYVDTNPHSRSCYHLSFVNIIITFGFDAIAAGSVQEIIVGFPKHYPSNGSNVFYRLWRDNTAAL